MAYVHGYSERETQRLYEQADILEDILHTSTAYPAGARVLEAGCGVGGQTRLLVKRSPDTVFTCVDVSERSLATARRLKAQEGFGLVSFQREDIHRLGFADRTAWLYADRLKPALRDGMVDHIIVPMVQSAETKILTDQLVLRDVYEQGIHDLSRVDVVDEGTFFYTWFKAVAKKCRE